MGDAFDLFVAGTLGDLFDHRRFVHLIRDFVDDDGPAIFADFFDVGFGAKHNRATPLKIRFARTRAAHHDTARGEVRTRNVFDQVSRRQIGIVDQRKGGIHNFAKVMRRNVGCHTHRDTARAVDQHVREARRKNGRLFVFAVVVVDEINGVFVDVSQHIGGWLVHADFGVAHRRSAVAIHRTKVTLTIEQGQRHREILRHTDQGVIDRRVAVRVIFTHHVADRTRRFAVGFIVPVVGLVHREKDATVHGF